MTETTPQNVDMDTEGMIANMELMLLTGREDPGGYFLECNTKDDYELIDTKSLEHRISNLSEKEINVFWTINSLQSYLQCERAPRGLRAYKMPAQFQDDPTFVTIWKQAHHEHALKLLQIVLTRNRIEHDRIKEDLEKLKLEYGKRTAEVQKRAFFPKLQEKLTKIQDEVKSKKREKFLRDRSDYDQNKEFIWHTKPSQTSSHATRQARRPSVFHKKRPDTAPNVNTTQGQEKTQDPDNRDQSHPLGGNQ